jgi:hypothetical protein
MQIDTAMRVNALLLVDDRDALCQEVLFGGKRFNALKDSNGNRLTDKHLREKLAENHPWISRVYEETSDFVHLSGRHFYTSIASIDDQTRVCCLSISGADPPRLDSTYFEVVDAFSEVSKITALMLLGFFCAEAQSGLT